MVFPFLLIPHAGDITIHARSIRNGIKTLRLTIFRSIYNCWLVPTFKTKTVRDLEIDNVLMSMRSAVD